MAVADWGLWAMACTMLVKPMAMVSCAKTTRWMTALMAPVSLLMVAAISPSTSAAVLSETTWNILFPMPLTWQQPVFLNLTVTLASGMIPISIGIRGRRITISPRRCLTPLPDGLSTPRVATFLPAAWAVARNWTVLPPFPTTQATHPPSIGISWAT